MINPLLVLRRLADAVPTYRDRQNKAAERLHVGINTGSVQKLLEVAAIFCLRLLQDALQKAVVENAPATGREGSRAA